MAQDGRTVSTLGEPEFPMLEYVNLNAELKLESTMLRGFGMRVDDARRSADPEAVAALAVMLSYAEELSGNRASSVTALRLLEEAVRIAEEQQNANAAAAIELAAQKIPDAEPVTRRLQDSLAMFSSIRGDGDFIGYVRVNNECDRVLDIYIDGQYMGFLFGGESSVYSTGNGTTQVRVMDAFGNTATEMLSLQPEQTVSWTLRP
jgi:hypothetical protein